MEEDYKTMKCRIEIENFTGKSALSVYLDFHARVFFKNLTAMLTFTAQEQVELSTAEGRSPQCETALRCFFKEQVPLCKKSFSIC
ncbi:MAG: hypothetical protein AB1461_20625 [Thermodesulfobacteriota bacterium]